jgi:hypothetical protein
MSGMLPPPDDPRLTELFEALRSAAGDLERCARGRRDRTTAVRERWRGGRRRDFDRAWDDLEAITRRVDADLRAARSRVAARLDGR